MRARYLRGPRCGEGAGSGKEAHFHGTDVRFHGAGFGKTGTCSAVGLDFDGATSDSAAAARTDGAGIGSASIRTGTKEARFHKEGIRTTSSAENRLHGAEVRSDGTGVGSIGTLSDIGLHLGSVIRTDVDGLSLGAGFGADTDGARVGGSGLIDIDGAPPGAPCRADEASARTGGTADCSGVGVSFNGTRGVPNFFLAIFELGAMTSIPSS